MQNNALFSTMRLLTLAGVPLILGCAVGPDFERPKAPTSQAYAPAPMPAETVSASVPFGAAQHFEPHRTIPADWWTLFHSPQLDALIKKVLTGNPTLESAQASLRQAQQNVIAQQGFFYPTLGLGYSPTRNKLAGNMGGNSPGVQGNGRIIQTYSNPAGPKFNGPVYYNFHVAQLTVGYVPDVFGGNRRQVESLQVQAEAQQFQLEAAYLTLVSNTVAAAIQEASLRAQIELLSKLVELNQENLGIMRKQLELGYIAEIDLAGQEASLAQAQQMLIPLQNQLEQTRDLIRALAGNLPDQDVPEVFDLAEFSLPQALPLSLPSQLVEQRPDIRIAEAQYHAACAQVGVAEAARLPQFSIIADYGGMAASPDWMFRAGAGFFNVIGNLTQTVLDGGTLRAREKAAREGLALAAADYRTTVIAAFQNVADTLHPIQSDAQLVEAASKTEQAMKNVLEISRRQYQLGQISYQLLLVAEQNYRQAALSLVQAQTGRLGDTAALYQALGGGWWNKKDAREGSQGPMHSSENKG